jgi:hypothetical protein
MAGLDPAIHVFRLPRGLHVDAYSGFYETVPIERAIDPAASAAVPRSSRNLHFDGLAPLQVGKFCPGRAIAAKLATVGATSREAFRGAKDVRLLAHSLRGVLSIAHYGQFLTPVDGQAIGGDRLGDSSQDGAIMR